MNDALRLIQVMLRTFPLESLLQMNDAIIRSETKASLHWMEHFVQPSGQSGHQGWDKAKTWMSGPDERHRRDKEDQENASMNALHAWGHQSILLITIAQSTTLTSLATWIWFSHCIAIRDVGLSTNSKANMIKKALTYEILNRRLHTQECDFFPFELSQIVCAKKHCNVLTWSCEVQNNVSCFNATFVTFSHLQFFFLMSLITCAHARPHVVLIQSHMQSVFYCVNNFTIAVASLILKSDTNVKSPLLSNMNFSFSEKPNVMVNRRQLWCGKNKGAKHFIRLADWFFLCFGSFTFRSRNVLITRSYTQARCLHDILYNDDVLFGSLAQVFHTMCKDKNMALQGIGISFQSFLSGAASTKFEGRSVRGTWMLLLMGRSWGACESDHTAVFQPRSLWANWCCVHLQVRGRRSSSSWSYHDLLLFTVAMHHSAVCCVVFFEGKKCALASAVESTSVCPQTFYSHTCLPQL